MNRGFQLRNATRSIYTKMLNQNHIYGAVFFAFVAEVAVVESCCKL